MLYQAILCHLCVVLAATSKAVSCLSTSSPAQRTGLGGQTSVRQPQDTSGDPPPSALTEGR
jgi:hypothetical protein